MDIGSFTLNAVNTYDNFFTKLHWTGTVGENRITIENKEMNIYPNPANIHVEVSIPQNTEATSYKLFDAKGNLMVTKDHLRTQKNFSIDVSQLPSEIYFIYLQTKNNVFTKKVIIRR